VERLWKVVVGPELETCHAIARLDAVAGDEQDRQVVPELVAQLATDLVPRKPRQADLDHHDCRALAAGTGKPVLACRRLRNGDARTREQTHRLGASGAVVIDDQDVAAESLGHEQAPSESALKESL
jgi:hypothetical protein